jgi:fatty acid/phospholipid biosynthesis enzyme
VSERVLLTLVASGLALAAGLATCVVQAHGHARAQALARVQRQCEMIEAANAQAAAIVESHIPGVPNPSTLDPRRARGEVHE